MNIFQRILGINWKTTLAGVTALIAVAGKVYSDIKTKDFSSFFTDAQSLFVDLSGIAIGFGLIKAKDGDTTGAGASAMKQ